MTKVRSWGLISWGVFFALLLVALAARPELIADVMGEARPVYVAVWGPMLIAGVVAWLLVRWFGERDQLDRRVAAALDGHPIHREVGWLMVFLGGFVLAMFVLSWVSSLYGEEIGMDLRMSVSLVSRLLFLFTLPMLVMDRSGVTIDGKGTAMPALALAAREPWRWLGLVPVALAVGLIAHRLVPVFGLPSLSLAVIGFFLAFALVSLCEEIFFRAMLQTRLEFILGRWGGIGATSIVFALAYAVTQPHDAVTQIRGQGFLDDLGLSLLSYGVGGVLYGYLWTCFRNVWITVSLRLALFVLVLPPGLEALLH
ncbi:CPBP family intramembrane glutamic endopeptidase [Nocardiopsis sp. FIRDI 009]|uniref:CPBP family intramembrane glutamic endopeptidase n=1 Tax=Nocardiopsis sp. FIRDI 009 TaxID=714197 RepID=UPI0018E59756|nr:CPBP family intramembrane glutamic endopeptidase [Nocardiopsis sp. FIRDI 009]